MSLSVRNLLLECRLVAQAPGCGGKFFLKPKTGEMEDILQPLIVILVGGLFAPLLTQLIERFLGEHGEPATETKKQMSASDKKLKRKRWLKLFVYAVGIQLILFTIFFLCSKWIYFDKNYFSTNERALIREGIRKGKDYVIPKMTIRVYSESGAGLPNSDSLCVTSPVHYCSLVSISYEIVALREFNDQKIFQEYYKALYAENVVREPGSEREGNDKNPQKVICDYDILTSMKKFERKTITTRVDYLYASLPRTREFMGQNITKDNWDFFYYPNAEDDVIGEVEFQVISRTLKFNAPAPDDAIYIDDKSNSHNLTPQLLKSNGNCLNFNILTSKIPELKNNETIGIKWSW